MLPQVNATLLSIAAGSSVASEDWDVTADTVDATLKWSGNTDAYVRERVRTTFAGNEGGLLRAKDVTVYISSDIVGADGSPLNLEEGDIFTYQYRGAIEARRVMTYDAPYLPGMNIAEYVRCQMQPEPVEDVLDMS